MQAPPIEGQRPILQRLIDNQSVTQRRRTSYQQQNSGSNLMLEKVVKDREHEKWVNETLSDVWSKARQRRAADYVNRI
jgi:hypothetical protein